MNPGNEIVMELKELASPLATMPRVMPFQVPEDYFATLTSALTGAAVNEDEPVLALPQEMPYQLPQGYFEGFAASVMDKVAEMPSFGCIDAPSFEVPAGYFEGLPQQILSAVKAANQTSAPVKKPTQVMPFIRLKAFQWAAAAGLILAIGLGGYKMVSNKPTVRLSAESQLAQLDKDLIKRYVAQHIDEFDTEMLAENSPILNISPEKNIHKMDESAIREFLEEDGGI